jgi:hypothetical protein
MAALLKVVATVHHTVEAAELSKDAQTDHSGLTKQQLVLPLLPPLHYNATSLLYSPHAHTSTHTTTSISLVFQHAEVAAATSSAHARLAIVSLYSCRSSVYVRE